MQPIIPCAHLKDKTTDGPSVVTFTQRLRVLTILAPSFRIVCDKFTLFQGDV